MFFGAAFGLRFFYFMTSGIKIVPSIFRKDDIIMTMFDDEIGKKIAVIRKGCNISAKDLSLAIGKKSDYIQRIEKGYFKPSTEPFFDICEKLGMSPVVLLNTNLELLEETVKLSARIEALEEDKKKKVMEKLYALVEEKMAEALAKKV